MRAWWAKENVKMRTYFKFLQRNKLYTIVEVIGLSAALGFVILLMTYARTEFSVGARQPNSKEIYAIGAGAHTGMTLGTAEEFFHSVPEIKSWTRVSHYGAADIMVGEEYYSAKAATLDTNFLKLFDYRVTGCDRDRILAGPGDALLSESFARRVFGVEDPVGKTFKWRDRQYTVTGTIEDFGPYDEFAYYDIFVNTKILDNMLQRMDNFGTVQTFVTLSDGADPDAVADKLLDKYMEYWDKWWHRDNSDGGFLYGSSLTRLDRIYFCNLDVYTPLRKGDRKVVEILLLVAVVLLVSAIFNYINLTVAQTGKRAKEMATRRLLGESGGQITLRYICEAFLFTAICFALGCLLAFALKGWFEGLLRTTVVIEADAATVASGLGLLLVVSLVSALLPAALIARFKPIDVVRGDFRLRSKMVFSKIFIVCQNVISTVLIAVSLTMLLQMRHMVNLPTGYQTEDLLDIRTWSLGYSNSAAQQALAERIGQLPQVEAVGRYASSPAACGSNGVHIEGEDMSWLRLVQIDTTAFRLFGFKVLEQYSEPVYGSCWMTEETKLRYGVSPEKPYVGDGAANKCHGIIADFRVNDALDEPMPDSHCAVMLRDCSEICFGMVVKTTGDHKEAIEAVRRVWIGVAEEFLGVPKEPDDVEYFDVSMNDALTGTRNTMKLVMSFMLLAILISALGLLAMAVYYTGQQSHEIALRKIFGSGVNEAAMKLSRQFVIMTLAAVIVAVPICFWAINLYLSDFYNRIAFPWWAIPVAALLTFAISAASITAQTLKTARANPVETLRQQE